MGKGHEGKGHEEMFQALIDEPEQLQHKGTFLNPGRTPLGNFLPGTFTSLCLSHRPAIPAAPQLSQAGSRIQEPAVRPQQEKAIHRDTAFESVCSH